MSHPVAPGIPRSERFADECHYFALALRTQAGGRLAYVGNRGRDGEMVPGHVVVTLAPGLHADADGIWAEPDLLAAWGAREVATVTRREVVRDLGGRLSPHARERIEAATAALARAPAFREACALAHTGGLPPGPSPAPG